MAETKKPTAQTNHTPHPDKQMPKVGKVVDLGAHKCKSDDCKKNPDRAGFCSEHFVWYKEGLITGEGQKARDFDKKYHAWMRRSKVA